jgi:hypothetical protein
MWAKGWHQWQCVRQRPFACLPQRVQRVSGGLCWGCSLSGRRVGKRKEPITQLTFKGVQIKSLECFRAFAASVADIEERCGIHEVQITMQDIFFCPWIDTEQCRDTPMERLLIGLVQRLKP